MDIPLSLWKQLWIVFCLWKKNLTKWPQWCHSDVIRFIYFGLGDLQFFNRKLVLPACGVEFERHEWCMMGNVGCSVYWSSGSQDISVLVSKILTALLQIWLSQPYESDILNHCSSPKSSVICRIRPVVNWQELTWLKEHTLSVTGWLTHYLDWLTNGRFWIGISLTTNLPDEPKSEKTLFNNILDGTANRHC